MGRKDNGRTGSTPSKKRLKKSCASSRPVNRPEIGRRKQQEDVEVEPSEQNKPRKEKSNKARKKNGGQSIDEEGGPESIYKGGTSGTTRETLDRDKPVTTEQRQCFEDFTRDAVSKGVKGILDEYAQNLKAFVPSGVTRNAFDANPKKNRYSDVICVDGSRVILKNYSTDYIHANYVRGDPLINTFICTQGPMMNSVSDFWKMVSQENVGNIIMLCDTVEQGKEKCQQYWPREQGAMVEWPGIQVKNIKVDNADSTTMVSTLELIYEKKEKITLKHHHWRTWPDKSVPQSVLAPFRLLKNVRHSPRPTIVHCSAGIGRTGSVVALELCYQQLLSENKLSVLESVKALRSQRMHAVQTELQFLYLYKCLLTFSQKSKTIPAESQAAFDNFEKEYQTLIDAKLAEEKPDEAYSPLTPIKFGKFAPIPM